MTAVTNPARQLHTLRLRCCSCSGILLLDKVVVGPISRNQRSLSAARQTGMCACPPVYCHDCVPLYMKLTRA